MSVATLVRPATPDGPLAFDDPNRDAVLGTLTARFAATADRHNRDATFPIENIAALRDAGLLALIAPKTLGGQAADLHTARRGTLC